MENLVDIDLFRYFIDTVVCVKYKSIKRYEINFTIGDYSGYPYIDITLFMSSFRYRQDIGDILFYYKRMLGYQECFLNIKWKDE